MSDFLDMQGAKDLNTDAIHIGAVANSKDQVTGAPIDTHVNRSGGVDYTLQGFWCALGPVVMPWTSLAGGTLTQPNQAFLHPTDGNYYSWAGAYPVGGYVVAPGTDPTAAEGYVPRTDVVLRDELAGDAGYALIGDGDIARLSTLKAKFGVAAWAQAANFKKFVIDIDDVKSGIYGIPTGQTVEFIGGARVGQTDGLPSFEAASSLWRITGNGSIYRTAGIPTSFVSGSVGISIKSTAYKWSIDGKIRVEHFADAGFRADGLSIVTGEVSRSSVDRLTCHENAYNYKFLAGFAAEYISLTNCYATGATACGVYEESGNINWIGGAITGNQGGVHLKHPASGANPHHGMFVGAHINHNLNYQLFADEVALGYDFSGCHFYDNGNSALGRIQLHRCRGINISGGTLGCFIEYVSDGAFTGHIGYNSIHGNKCEAAAAIVTGSGFDRTKLFVYDNFDINGAWSFDDSERVDYISTSTSNVVMPADSTIGLHKLDTVLADNRGTASGATFRPPWNAHYEWLVSLYFTSTTKIQGMWVDIVRDDTASGTFSVLASVPVIAISDTQAMCNGSLSFPASKNGQLGFILRSSGLLNANGAVLKSGALVSIKSNK